MERSTPPSPDVKSGEQEVYTLKSADVSALMSERTVKKQAQFFLPRLRANMSLLDCGCGPGSITCGLAVIVSPGETVGIDINPDDIERAQALAVEQDLANVRFETADVYELPFADGSFDAVFSHALLEHLRDPLKALTEMRRVLKSGGIIGVRAPDHAGNLTAPRDPEVTRSEELYRRMSEHNGGNPYVGKHLRALLRQAAFTQIESSASYDLWTKSDLPGIKELPFMKRFVELGWVDMEEVDRMGDAYQVWVDHPDMFNARAYCEAIAWKL